MSGKGSNIMDALITEMRNEYTKGKGDVKAYGFWVNLKQKIKKN